VTTEIRDIRAKCQNYRQTLLRADYNHADEELARTIYFADHTPIIAGVLHQLRSTSTYRLFDPLVWLQSRRPAYVLGSGHSNLGFSLDESERSIQCLKVLEFSIEKRQNGLLSIGETTYGGSSTKYTDHVHSAIEVIFDPFYHYVDSELRSLESLITPTDIINQVQSLVDGESSINYPQTHKLLTDAYRQLFTLTAASTGMSWNKAGYSCRDVLIQFANEIFDPEYVPKDQEQPKGDDAKAKLKWVVRHFLKQDGAGDRFREAIEDIVQANWDFINSVGHRQKSATEEDARLAVIYTYLTISIVDNAKSRAE
jgi:hypothetical protein